ncbi:MAG: AI-2E family transporter [Clostridia bacterium]|nr:AI-2E family transporter [Clostridia bacterium]
MLKRLRAKPWFNYTVAACSAVLLYVILVRFQIYMKALRTFLNFFSPVFLAIVIAYVVNPLARLLRRTLFRKIRKEKPREMLANIVALLLILALVALVLVLLIPQLIESVRMFIANMDSYVASLSTMLEKWGVEQSRLDLSEFITSSEQLLDYVANYVTQNTNAVLRTSALAGRILTQWIIAFILAVYLLGERRRLKRGSGRLMRALFRKERHNEVMKSLKKCDRIMTRYIAFNVLDSAIVGSVNAVFMLILSMPYVGLVSFIVAVTNLIPTFGPVVGGAIGAFILFLAKPWYAFAFIAFAVAVQLLDGYIIKPKLFGDTLGVSGMWILIGVIVGGRMFGAVGMLLAIPAVAILEFLYRDYLLPYLEKRRLRKDAELREQEAAE